METNRLEYSKEDTKVFCQILQTLAGEQNARIYDHCEIMSHGIQTLLMQMGFTMMCITEYDDEIQEYVIGTSEIDASSCRSWTLTKFGEVPVILDDRPMSKLVAAVLTLSQELSILGVSFAEFAHRDTDSKMMVISACGLDFEKLVRNYVKKCDGDTEDVNVVSDFLEYDSFENDSVKHMFSYLIGEGLTPHLLAELFCTPYSEPDARPMTTTPLGTIVPSEYILNYSKWFLNWLAGNNNSEVKKTFRCVDITIFAKARTAGVAGESPVGLYLTFQSQSDASPLEFRLYAGNKMASTVNQTGMTLATRLDDTLGWSHDNLIRQTCYDESPLEAIYNFVTKSEFSAKLAGDYSIRFKPEQIFTCIAYTLNSLGLLFGQDYSIGSEYSEEDVLNNLRISNQGAGSDHYETRAKLLGERLDSDPAYGAVE
tara:strand:+ start:774 stop:2054 length:1281 start_codon:yes stop_codon:yes gene_type:complete